MKTRWMGCAYWCLYIYTCMQADWTHTHTQSCAHLFIHLFLYVRMYVCIYLSIHLYICVRVFMYIQLSTYLFKKVDIDTHTHTVNLCMVSNFRAMSFAICQGSAIGITIHQILKWLFLELNKCIHMKLIMRSCTYVYMALFSVPPSPLLPGGFGSMATLFFPKFHAGR